MWSQLGCIQGKCLRANIRPRPLPSAPTGSQLAFRGMGKTLNAVVQPDGTTFHLLEFTFSKAARCARSLGAYEITAVSVLLLLIGVSVAAAAAAAAVTVCKTNLES